MMSTVQALRCFVTTLAVGVTVGLLSLTVAHAAGPPDTERDAYLIAQGERLFALDFTPERGLGPLCNGTSCLTCHNTPSAGGMGGNGLATVLRVGQLHHKGFDPLMGQGGPIVRTHSVVELGQPCGLALGTPAGVNMTSIRNTPPLFGSGLIDALPDDVILAGAVPRGHGVHGRPHLIRDAQGRQRVGRFGWKADTATFPQFVADAFRNELGLTNPLAPTDLLPIAHGQRQRCAGEADTLEDDGTTIVAVTAYLASLAPPALSAPLPAGAQVFAAIGCVACHTPSLLLGDRQVSLYSDLLLHNLGPDLDDKVSQGQAAGSDWRTTPLWGLGTRPRLLHDGRARTLVAAIMAHGGEAASAVRHFRELSSSERDILLAFLRSL
jgi:CxxC motif-containing protein (DUF1111 family)